jgi:hypothetical protein
MHFYAAPVGLNDVSIFPVRESDQVFHNELISLLLQWKRNWVLLAEDNTFL